MTKAPDCSAPLSHCDRTPAYVSVVNSALAVFGLAHLIMRTLVITGLQMPSFAPYALKSLAFTRVRVHEKSQHAAYSLDW